MSTTPASSGPDEILSGPLLGALRREAGLKQTEVVSLVSVSQAQLSRIEQREWRSRPSPETTREILELYAAQTGPLGERRVPSLTPERIDSLVAQAQALRIQHVDARVILQAGQAHNFQLRTREAESNAKVVRSYHPTTILGVLQTRAFASAWFADERITREDANASIEQRMRRWDALSEPGRRWLLVQTEQALRWPVKDYQLQADQLDQMIAASRLPNVSLRIIRLDTLATSPAPLTGFHVYDQREAVVGTDLGTALVGDPERVSDYLSKFLALEALALSPDDSRALLSALSQDYRARGRARE